MLSSRASSTSPSTQEKSGKLQRRPKETSKPLPTVPSLHHRVSHSTDDVLQLLQSYQEPQQLEKFTDIKTSTLKRQKSLTSLTVHEEKRETNRPYSQDTFDSGQDPRDSKISFLDARTRESMLLAHQSMHAYLNQLSPDIPECDQSAILPESILQESNQSFDSYLVNENMNGTEDLESLLKGVPYKDWLLQDEDRLSNGGISVEFLRVLNKWLIDIDQVSGIRAVGGKQQTSEPPRMNPTKFLERRRKYIVEQRRLQQEIQKEKRYHEATWQLLQLYTSDAPMDDPNKYSVSVTGSGSTTPTKATTPTKSARIGTSSASASASQKTPQKESPETTEERLRQALQGQRWTLPSTPALRQAHDAALQAYWQSTQQLLSLEHQFMHVMRKLELLDRRWMSCCTRELIGWVCRWKRDSISLRLQDIRASSTAQSSAHSSPTRVHSASVDDVQWEMMNLCREWVRQGDARYEALRSRYREPDQSDQDISSELLDDALESPSAL